MLPADGRQGPLSLLELEARVQAHLRREARSRGETQVRFSGELTIDYSQRTLSVRGEKIPLAKKEFDIVELLSQNAGQVFDKERIYERVWGGTYPYGSKAVDLHIQRMRKKVGWEQTLKAVNKVGYRLEV